MIVGPRTGGLMPIREGRRWASDNDAFHGRFTEAGFLTHLRRLTPFQDTCLFVTCPDVVADKVATALLYAEWAPRLHDLAFPVAWVAQDGAGPDDIPGDCDAVFIGGSTEWKLGSDAWAVCRAAKEQGKWIHMGRVNSHRRTVHAARMGVDSVDGTHFAFVGHQQGCLDITAWLQSAVLGRRQERLL